MKAFLIDPFNQTITETEYNGDIEEIYELGDFDRFDVVTFNEQGDGIYVDDEGLFKEGQQFFSITGFSQPFAGKGVVIGCDDEGASVSPSASLEWLRKNISFRINVGF